MIVYYVSDVEKPTNTNDIKFFTDNSTAHSYAKEVRSFVYQFEVNNKCDTNSFGMDTQMVFTCDETGELKFLASGRWLEIHELLNIPFYQDFEARSKNFVSMSQRYFLDHYYIKEIGEKKRSQQPVIQKEDTPKRGRPKKTETKETIIEENILSELFN